METDREFDVLVAERVMGLHVKIEVRTVGMATGKHGPLPVTSTFYRLVDEKGDCIYGYGPLMHGYGPVEAPGYSTNIEAAWAVVPRMHDKGFHTFSLLRDERGWTAMFSNGNRFYASKQTAPLAICSAALSAVGVEAS